MVLIILMVVVILACLFMLIMITERLAGAAVLLAAFCLAATGIGWVAAYKLGQQHPAKPSVRSPHVNQR